MSAAQAQAEWAPKPNVDIAEGWKQRLIVSKEGGPKPILANAISALRHAPQWQSVLAFNEFTLTISLQKPAPWGGTGDRTWSDIDDIRTAEWLQHNGILVGTNHAGQSVQAVAEDRRFHPVREYLASLRWDQTERISSWLSLYLGVEPSTYAAEAGRRWLIQAVARVHKPGCKADNCIILEGRQGLKKSMSLNYLSEPWFTDEISELGTKDAAMQVAGVWVMELAELESLSRAEAGRIKAFMSRAADRFRPPYGHRVISAPRQSVFAGTVNGDSYLKDETGGRRFWPISCGEIAINDLKRDRDQLWAEAKAAFDAGAPWWFDTRELENAAEEEQEGRFDDDPWSDAIREYLEADRDFVTIGQVLVNCIGKPLGNQTQQDKNRVARCLRAAKWKRYRQRIPGDGVDKLPWRYRRKR